MQKVSLKKILIVEDNPDTALGYQPIGWHTFRHSYATHLKANGEDVKVVQESLRHANSRITLDTYTQALTTAKREAQTKGVRTILPERNQSTAVGRGK